MGEKQCKFLVTFSPSSRLFEWYCSRLFYGLFFTIFPIFTSFAMQTIIQCMEFISSSFRTCSFPSHFQSKYQVHLWQCNNLQHIKFPRLASLREWSWAKNIISKNFERSLYSNWHGDAISYELWKAKTPPNQEKRKSVWKYILSKDQDKLLTQTGLALSFSLLNILSVLIIMQEQKHLHIDGNWHHDIFWWVLLDALIWTQSKSGGTRRWRRWLSKKRLYVSDILNSGAVFLYDMNRGRSHNFGQLELNINSTNYSYFEASRLIQNRPKQ